jgi:hypothetical protein
MFYAWTATYACGFTTNDVFHIGSVTFKVLDELTSEVVFDTCAFPPRCHLSFTNGPYALDYWPHWQPVKAMKSTKK